MKVVFEHENFIVIDDLFSEVDFASIREFLGTEPMKYMHSKEWIRTYRLGDGVGLEGPVYVSHKDQISEKIPAYPVEKPIDLVFGSLLSMGERIAPWTGNVGKDWQYFSGRSYIYPRGTGLAWHDDRSDVSAAYIYYAHAEWKSSWGGELEILNETPRTSGPPRIEERVLSEGMGHFVLPKPNRLVIFKAGVAHCIKKVDPDAGENHRCSISGFFFKGQK